MRKLFSYLLFIILVFGAIFSVIFVFSDYYNVEKNDNNKLGEFENGQKYEVFKTGEFEVKFPYWPKIKEEYLVKFENLRFASVNDGCSFMISTSSIPADLSFKEGVERLIEEQLKNTESVINVKEITDNSSHLEIDITENGNTLTNVSYDFLTNSGEIYGLGFASEKSNFEKSCRPFIQEVIDSIKIN